MQSFSWASTQPPSPENVTCHIIKVHRNFSQFVFYSTKNMGVLLFEVHKCLDLVKICPLKSAAF